MARDQTDQQPPPAQRSPVRGEPARVPLAMRPLGLWGTAMTARRNVLELIPAIATRQPIVSGTTGLRWHLVMDPASLRRILKVNRAGFAGG